MRNFRREPGRPRVPNSPVVQSASTRLFKRRFDMAKKMGNPDKTPDPVEHATGVGVAMGVAFGAAFGAAFDNTGIGIALGVAIGAALGAATGAGMGGTPKKNPTSGDNEAK